MNITEIVMKKGNSTLAQKLPSIPLKEVIQQLRGVEIILILDDGRAITSSLKDLADAISSFGFNASLELAEGGK